VLRPFNIKFVNLSVLRLTRLTKLSRFFKALRFSENLSELRVIIHTLGCALRGTFWTAIFLTAVIAAGGIFMTQLAQPFLEDDAIGLQTRQWLYEHFGTISASMHTMFEATFTGGWRFFSRPLVEEVHYAFGAFWFVWVVMVNFVTMRVLAALFMHQTMEVATLDSEKQAMSQLRRRGESSSRLLQMFQAADTSNDGGIGQEEFDKMMALRTVVEEFAKMGLDLDEVNQLFSVLVSDDGNADYDEFIRGALAMASSAPALNIVKNLQHTMLMETGIQKIIQYVSPVGKLSSQEARVLRAV